jgi:hypothetical protein
MVRAKYHGKQSLDEVYQAELVAGELDQLQHDKEQMYEVQLEAAGHPTPPVRSNTGGFSSSSSTNLNKTVSHHEKGV